MKLNPKFNNIKNYLNYYKEIPLIVNTNPLLREKCEEVSDLSQIKIIKKLMLDKMNSLSGIGLAGPQIGLNLRIFVIKEFLDEDNFHENIIINPKIIDLKGKISFKEGCLSLPSTDPIEIERSSQILLEYTNEKGKIVKKMFTGINAVCVQHEIDHLNGILIIDYLNKTIQ